jgi:SagB-type dehydrogenase family enzyme
MSTIEEERREKLKAAALASAPSVSGPMQEIGEVRFNLLEETIVPSPKTVELLRTPTNDATQRLMTSAPHIAEVFHENSRISPHSQANLILDDDALTAARDWFYTTAFAPREGVFDLEVATEHEVMLDLDAVASHSGRALGRLGDDDLRDTLFGMDLLVLRGHGLYRLFPGNRQLWIEYFLSPEALARVRGALPQLALEPEDDTVLAFVVSAAWRYMLLQGPRGYRRTLMDCGRLLTAVDDAAAKHGTLIRVSTDFYDAQLDAVLKLDGVERGTLAAIAFDGHMAQPAVTGADIPEEIPVPAIATPALQAATDLVAEPQHGLLPQLRELLANRSAEDQAVIYEMLSRSLSRMTFVDQLDEMSLVHGALKADALAVDHQELESAKAPSPMKVYPDVEHFALPREPLALDHTLDRVLRARASRRDFSETPLELAQLGTVLHYAFGVRKTIRAYNTRDFPVRYAPTSGGLQSNELYLVVNSVEGIPKGLYHYAAHDHSLDLLDQGNMRRKMVTFCQRQEWIQYASVILIVTGNRERLEWKYGTRAHSFMHMDAGFLGENVYLTATALGLRASALAGFSEDAVNDLLRIDGHNELAMLLFPIGTKAGPAAVPGL